MSIDTTSPTTDIIDNSSRILGDIGTTDWTQTEYLSLILNELRKVSLILAEITNDDIDFDEVIE